MVCSSRYIYMPSCWSSLNCPCLKSRGCQHIHPCWHRQLCLPFKPLLAQLALTSLLADSAQPSMMDVASWALPCYPLTPAIQTNIAFLSQEVSHSSTPASFILPTLQSIMIQGAVPLLPWDLPCPLRQITLLLLHSLLCDISVRPASCAQSAISTESISLHFTAWKLWYSHIV